MKLVKTKQTEAGLMRVYEDDEETVYDIQSYAGYFRGGRTYFADKVFRVLSGEVYLIQMDDKGNLDKRRCTPVDGEIVIPNGVAHIFESLCNSSFIERFPNGTSSIEVPELRELKKR